MGLACLVAAQTDQLVYGPLLVAAPLVAEGALAELEIPGFRRADPLFLATSTETVSARVYQALADTLRTTFAKVRHASAIVPVDPTAVVRAIASS